MPLPPIPLRCYPCFHACHLANVPNTAHIENLGAAIMASNPLAWPQVDAFVSAVCAWGGYAGIAGRVRNNNTQTEIIGGFSSARRALAQGHIINALSAVRGLHSLGRISFASKHLRMLQPTQCGVLDTLVIGAGFGYTESVASYVQYCSDCSAKAAALNASGILTSTGQLWNAGSVDMAIFAWIKNRSGRKSWDCRCAGDDHPLFKPCALKTVPRTEDKRGSSSVRPLKEVSKNQTTPPTAVRGIEHPRNRTPSGDIFIQHMRKGSFFAIKEACGKGTPNMGALEERPRRIPDGTLNAKQDLVDEIAARGGNFLVQPGFHPAIPPALRTRRVSGQNYIGWREFGNINAAIKYLQLYFTVQACDNATRQAIVDHGGPALP